MQRFKLPKAPSTTTKSIRFPDQIVEGIEQAICRTECSFSAFVVEAARVALQNLKEDK